MRVTTRFAPSPTGRLHLGHAYSAILNHDRARAAGGRFLLRIEDIDEGRCRPEFEDAIRDDLTWLGLAWDERVLRQSDRLDVYAAALEGLRARGLLYRCFLTRAEVQAALSAPHGPAPAFTGAPLPPAEEAARLSAGDAFAWRLSMNAVRDAVPDFDDLLYREQIADGIAERPAHARAHGDVVLGRKDNGTSYHLASVVDDIESEVTLTLRGEDLRDAAGLHVLLYRLLGADPPVYAHHPLVTDEDGRRLAKRDRAVTIAALRERGATPADLRARLGLAA